MNVIYFFFITLLLSWTGVTGQEKPLDPEVHYRAAKKAEKTRNYRKALGEYKKVLSIKEDYKDSIYLEEECEVLVKWQDTLKGNPPTARQLVKLGEILLDLGREQEERTCYEEAIELDHDCAEAHGHLALWNYTTQGGSILTVINETMAFLNTSPHKKYLAKAIADFKIYGQLRTLRIVLQKELILANKLVREKKWQEAASTLEKTARAGIPDVFHTYLYTRAGTIRLANKDIKGARAAFTKALAHAPCSYTLQAHLGLASLDTRSGAFASALTHLRAAVKEGSAACQQIAKLRETDFKALFTAESAEIRREIELLTEQTRGDEPIVQEINKALQRAGLEKKRVLLHFYGPYCPYVMMMEEQLARPPIRQFLKENFIHYRVNYGSHHRAMTLDRKYGDVFRYHGVPCLYILDPDGTTLRVIKCNAVIMRVLHRCYDEDKILKALKAAAKY